MFDKLKQIKKIREMQNSLAQERAEVEEDGVKVIMNGKMELEDVVITKEMSKEETEKAVKKAINNCLKEVQMIAARKMQEMGGF